MHKKSHISKSLCDQLLIEVGYQYQYSILMILLESDNDDYPSLTNSVSLFPAVLVQDLSHDELQLHAYVQPFRFPLSFGREDCYSSYYNH
jgi:hypothetical protein